MAATSPGVIESIGPRQLSVLLLLGCCLAFLAGARQGQPREVVAEKITIVDANGNPAMVLGTELGSAAVRLYHPGSKLKADVLLTEDGISFVFNEDTRNMVVIGRDKADGSAFVQVEQEASYIRTGMHKGSPNLRLRDAASTMILHTSNDPVQCGISMLDRKSTRRLSLLYNDDFSSLSISDPKGDTKALIAVTKDGEVVTEPTKDR